MWPGASRSRSSDWAIIGVFDVCRPLRGEIKTLRHDTGNSMFLCLCLGLCHSIFSARAAEKVFCASEKPFTPCEFQPIRNKYFFSPNIGSVFGTPCVNPNCTLQNVFQAGGCHSSSGV